ncbi:MAG TPA: hypothetical protein VFA33_03540 [Bryobacteraceae bacterium]|nr:hypothetical protein [Bryobacteraceae bacterium]
MHTASSRARRLALVLLGGAALAAAQTSQTVIDNDQVRVLKVVVQPHQKTRLHQHTVNRVMVYLQAGRQTLNYQGGKAVDLAWKRGEAKWSPASGMHTAEITSDQPVTIVEIELKKPGAAAHRSSPLDPVKVDPQHYRVEFENSQVRVLRVKIPGHASTPMHEHTLNRVVTYLADQDFRVTPAGGTAEHATHHAGDVSWGGPAKHKEENLAATPFEVLVVELKS